MAKTRLAFLREKKGLKQKEVANRLGIGTSTYSEYERGTREPDIARLIAIADFFGTTLDFLLMHDSPNPEKALYMKLSSLDEYGKDAVRAVLEVEYHRCTDTEARTITASYTPVRKASRSKDGKPVREEQISSEDLQKIMSLPDMDDTM